MRWQNGGARKNTMHARKKRNWRGAERSEYIHAARTAFAAVVSLTIARMFRLPESYWAAITTIIVLQSTLGAAWTMSKQRLAGTAMGAAAGALLGTFVGPYTGVIAVGVFGAGLFALGVICAMLHIERNAYRYAGITLAIVMLVARTQAVWIIAVHRFFEISVGIAVGLILTAVWPEALPKVAS
jgi:uncharacterized membrane protein YccC